MSNFNENNLLASAKQQQADQRAWKNKLQTSITIGEEEELRLKHYLKEVYAEEYPGVYL